MKIDLYAIRDKVANSYHNPMTFPNAGSAARSFADELNRASADNMLYAHPDDFDMWLIGFYDNETGKIDPMENPQLVFQGSVLKIRN